MSTKKITIRPGERVTITNNGATGIRIWTGSPPKEYGRHPLGAGESDLIFNNSDSGELPVLYEDNGSVQIDPSDLDDC